MNSKKIDVLSIDKDNCNMDGVMNLAEGVVRQAAEDYEAAFLGYMIDGKTPDAVINELDKWFESEDYSMFTKVDGKRLRKLIKINALEKIIDAYKTALRSGRVVKLRLLIPMPKHVPNVNEQIPPILMADYKKIMEKQIKELEAMKKIIEEEVEGY